MSFILYSYKYFLLNILFFNVVFSVMEVINYRFVILKYIVFNKNSFSSIFFNKKYNFNNFKINTLIIKKNKLSNFFYNIWFLNLLETKILLNIIKKNNLLLLKNYFNKNLRRLNVNFRVLHPLAAGTSFGLANLIPYSFSAYLTIYIAGILLVFGVTLRWLVDYLEAKLEIFRIFYVNAHLIYDGFYLFLALIEFISHFFRLVTLFARITVNILLSHVLSNVVGLISLALWDNNNYIGFIMGFILSGGLLIFEASINAVQGYIYTTLSKLYNTR